MQDKAKIQDAAIAISFALLIYGSLPFAPGFWAKIAKITGVFSGYIAASILLLAVIAIALYLGIKKRGLVHFIWLAVLSVFYAAGLISLKLPIERIHFVEYGLLAFLVFRALRHYSGGKALYLYSGIAVFGVGFIDEAIQYILPNRVFDARDVIVNSAAGVLALLLIRLCFQPLPKSAE